MADVDVDQGLEGWVENNFDGPGAVQSTAEVQSQADVCTAEAAVAGITSHSLRRQLEATSPRTSQTVRSP